MGSVQNTDFFVAFCFSWYPILLLQLFFNLEPIVYVGCKRITNLCFQIQKKYKFYTTGENKNISLRRTFDVEVLTQI